MGQHKKKLVFQPSIFQAISFREGNWSKSQASYPGSPSLRIPKRRSRGAEISCLQASPAEVKNHGGHEGCNSTTQPKETGWWLNQPIWKILVTVTLDIETRDKGKNKKYLKFHHLENIDIHNISPIFYLQNSPLLYPYLNKRVDEMILLWCMLPSWYTTSTRKVYLPFIQGGHRDWNCFTHCFRIAWNWSLITPQLAKHG